MRTVNLFIFFSCATASAACRPSKEPSDMQEIARGYCRIVQMCDLLDAWESQAACERNSVEEFKIAETEDQVCFDARLAMETCIGSFETCDEYNDYDQGEAQTCHEEFNDYYDACSLP